MFIRKRKNPAGSTSIQIVQKIGSSLKIIKHIGTSSDPTTLSKLYSEAQDILHNSPISLFDKMPDIGSVLENIEIVDIHFVGFSEVFGSVFKKAGYHNLCLDTLLEYLVIARIAKPTSKLATSRWLSEKMGKIVSDDQIYRFMDTLDDDMERLVTDHTFNFVKNILGKTINIIFFDATTLHFETFKADKFRKTGFSKVGKHNQPQIVIGLMVTEEGLPIGYDVYPGNEFDGHTIRSALKRVSRRYNVKDVVFVADNAMMSKENVEIIDKANFKFIMAARIKSMSNFFKEQILDDSKYESNILDIDYGKSQRLVVTYSADRARKDRIDREKNLDQIKKRLTKRSKITKSKMGKIGKSKYLHVDGEAEVSINYQAVRADEVWDGLKGYMTNIPRDLLSAEHVVSKYAELWQVEKAFRVSKGELNIRPIFHYKRKRIRAHILIVFMSLFVSRYTEILLKELGITTRRLVEILETVQEIYLTHPSTTMRVKKRTRLSEVAQKIYRILEIPIPR